MTTSKSPPPPPSSVGKKATAAKQGGLAAPPFPVAGVGASAGGLEALTQLFSRIDVNTGIAYVIVQHLAADHPSFLTEILGKSSRLPVVEVKDGLALAPDHVYVMPPNVKVTLVGHRLKLTPRGKSKGAAFCPIDDFLKSLAGTCRELALGIILSGTGSDGAKGIAAITRAGGVTLAQDKKTAKYTGMPAAALAAGADSALAPEAIATELTHIARSLQSSSPSSQVPASLDTVLLMVNAARGMDFSQYKVPTVQRRILRRMAICHQSSIDNYIAYLTNNPAEIDCLYEDILVKVTCFFRIPESFEALKEEVFPALLEKEKVKSGKLRIWVPGCATGEEAYSLAICLLEFIDTAGLTNKVEIFASDMSDSALAFARQGQYPASISEQVSAERLSRFFVKESAGYRVCMRVRECCIFAKQNVVRDPPFSKLGLISCRNLMIYLSPTLQRRVLAAFHFALAPNGFLALGNAETIGSASDLFEVSNKVHKIFSRKTAPRGAYTSDFALDGLGSPTASVSSHPARPEDPTRRLDIKSRADRAVLAHYVPSGVVVNDSMEVLQVRGDTSRYLMLPPGELSANLFKMCRPGLLVDLRKALHDAAQFGRAVKKEGWVKDGESRSSPLIINVIPFTGPFATKPYFVVLFSEHNPTSMAEYPPALGHTNDLQRFERELAATKEYLNSIIEKEQATNEELKSAGEEILSANEELQSANEEMAMAKEESQATNEELTTVNDELQNRNQELGRVNSDLANLFGSVQIPILMLSDNLAIRRFTPAAEKALGLSAADVGCLLKDTAAAWAFEGLIKLVSEVLESLNTRDQEVQDRNGHWYSLRIKPYRTNDNKIDGVIMVLIDIDSLKKSFAQLKIAHEYADVIVQTAPVPILVLDTQLRILSANQSFYKNFHVKESAASDVRLFDLDHGEWDLPKLRTLLEERLNDGDLIENFIVDHVFKSLGRRIMRFSARKLEQRSNQPGKILLAIQDLTEEKRTEEGIRIAKEAAEAANQAKSDFLANMSHEIRTPLGAILGYSEILANPSQKGNDARQAASRIRRNVEQLTELIDEILDIAKIEAGKLDVNRVQFALLPELAETFILLQGRAEGKGLRFDVDFRTAMPETITSCPMRLRQILFNIVGNALKFTESGHVSIEIMLSAGDQNGLGRKLSFDVKDSGCGLSLEQQGRLFLPFSQADSSVTRRFGGTGLGLMLARQLAVSLGGNVSLEESIVGKGSSFIISIDPGPLAGVTLHRNINYKALERRQDEATSDWFVANDRLGGTRCLLVEDGPDNQAVISHFLTASGATVDLAVNGAEAIAMAQNGSYDFVLMDVQMPILDGYEASTRLRSAGFEAPIIALTAHAMQGERQRCLRAGCDDYISKPAKATTLIETIERVLKKKK